MNSEMECMMDHQKYIELLPAYLDQELGTPDLLDMERHLGSCAGCRKELAELRRVSEGFKKQAVYFTAPDHLAHRIAANLPRSRRTDAGYKGWSLGLSWMSLGVALGSLVALIWSGVLYVAVPSTQDKLVDELVSSHVRSLLVDHLADVASSDKHTVKPWFNGKLDYSPPVFDLASNGFPLTGGRLDYLNGRAVAVLVYRRKLHPINVYVWPSKNSVAPTTREQQGYNLIGWSANGMEYWAVSDLAANELEMFVTTLRGQS
jgi:anti-sigma factor RsiW